MNPASKCYSIMKNSFADHSQLQQVSDNDLTRGYKSGKEWGLDAALPRRSITRPNDTLNALTGRLRY